MRLEITTTPEGVQTISSLEIARATGKLHKNVMRDIRATLKELKSEQMRLDAGGRDQPCFLLPKREALLVTSGYSAKFRLAI